MFLQLELGHTSFANIALDGLVLTTVEVGVGQGPAAKAILALTRTEICEEVTRSAVVSVVELRIGLWMPASRVWATETETH